MITEQKCFNDPNLKQIIVVKKFVVPILAVFTPVAYLVSYEPFMPITSNAKGILN